EYFYLSTLYAADPLIILTFTIVEATIQTRTPQKQVQDAAIQELTELTLVIPVEWPAGDRGTLDRAAAYGIKGRLLMTQQNWAEAAAAFKSVIDLGVHTIDPRYKELFEESGETSSENILFTNVLAGLYGNSHNQRNYHPDFYGGYSESFL